MLPLEDIPILPKWKKSKGKFRINQIFQAWKQNVTGFKGSLLTMDWQGVCGHVRLYIADNKSDNCEHNSMDIVLSDAVQADTFRGHSYTSKMEKVHLKPYAEIRVSSALYSAWKQKRIGI